MKHRILGGDLLKSDKKRHYVTGGNPKITDLFLDRVENEDKEGKEPPEGDITIFHYHDHYHHLDSKYTINRNGEVKGLRGEIMKYFFHPNKRGPRVRIKMEKLGKNGESVFIEKEIGILQMMERNYGRYFPGYRIKRKFPKDYILVTKDGDYNNMRYNNLHYVCKDENTKKKLIKDYMKLHLNVDEELMANLFNTSQGYVRKIRQELVDEGYLPRFGEYQKFQKEIGIEFTEDNFEIYKLLVQSQGKFSNMEIAKLLWPEEIESAEDKSFYTNKVVRARKKLTDKGIIPRINGKFESQREEAIRMLKDKVNSGKTNKEIADALGLKKGQIDNLARQVKKEEKK